MKPGDPGSRDLEEPRCGAPRRRAAVAAGRLRSRDASLHLRHRQPDARLHCGPAARATISSRARSSPSTSTRARWRGTSRRRRTTRTTGIPRRRRCSSTAMFNGSDAQAGADRSRNGYFFTLDRVTGEHIVTSKFAGPRTGRRSRERTGQPVRNPEKDHHIGGALVVGQRRRDPTGRRPRIQPGHRPVLRSEAQTLRDVST